MDIEKLIEQANRFGMELRRDGGEFEYSIGEKFLDYATALSTLQAENESLKEKLYDGEGVNLVDYWMQQAKIEENGHRNCQVENEKLRVEAEGMRSNWYKSVEEIKKLRAELERVKAERDAAVKDMEALMWFSGEGCHICAHEIIIHKEPYVRSECALGNCAACCPTWRGQKED